ncbi:MULTISPECIES: hypothetical protein [unclassified Pseudomonas]|uniref:Uncharacterized protein n=1 Tax=Pseudomonas sp. MYb327 TaxID=2745230 RepID=A0AAU8EB20_9PSED
MSEADLNTSVPGRRRFLQALALLSLVGLTVGFSKVGSRPPAEKPGFVVINGWVLPSQYFRQTRT